MRLKIQKVKIDYIVFGNETNVSGTQLTIHKDALIEQLKELPNIKDIKIDLAMPGRKNGLLPVKDVIEPRVKVKGDGKGFLESLAASLKWATVLLNL